MSNTDHVNTTRQPAHAETYNPTTGPAHADTDDTDNGTTGPAHADTDDTDIPSTPDLDSGSSEYRSDESAINEAFYNPVRTIRTKDLRKYLHETGELVADPDEPGGEADRELTVRHKELREELSRRKQEGEITDTPSPIHYSYGESVESESES